MRNSGFRINKINKRYLVKITIVAFSGSISMRGPAQTKREFLRSIRAKLRELPALEHLGPVTQFKLETTPNISTVTGRPLPKGYDQEYPRVYRKGRTK